LPATADQIALALALLVPGFVWMKVFYFYGLRTRKSDPQWFLWSLLLSAPVASLRAFFGLPADRIDGVIVAILLALAGGLFSVWVWRRVVEVWPTLRVTATVGAWDSVFGVPWGQWIQIKTRDGVNYLGWPAYVGQRSDTDDPDIYLRQVEIVNADGSTTALGGEGVLLTRSGIESIIVFPASGHLPGPPAWVGKLSEWWSTASARLTPTPAPQNPPPAAMGEK
jgi:Family of unknown function (DUF6338)